VTSKKNKIKNKSITKYKTVYISHMTKETRLNQSLFALLH